MSIFKILVVIPVFNKEDTIKRAIDSVIHQTEPCDLLIINDGSTDNSAQILDGLSDPRIKVLHQENQGVSCSRNLGIRSAVENKYTHVAFLDADDYWLSYHIDQLKKVACLFPDADLIANNYKIHIGNNKCNKTKFSNLKNQEPLLLEPFFKYNLLNSVLSSSSFCMKTSDHDILFYNKEITHTEDTDFLIKAGLHKKIAFHPEPSVIIDQTAANRSHTVALQDRVITDFDSFEEKGGQVPELKKYLDINRFSIAIGYRLSNDIKNAAIYQRKIDLKNLSLKQQQLLKMSSRQLMSLKKTQDILGNLGFRLRTGR